MDAYILSPTLQFWNAGRERKCNLASEEIQTWFASSALVLIPFHLQERAAILQCWEEVFVRSLDDSLGAANLIDSILLLWRKVHHNFHKKRFEIGQSTEMETILQLEVHYSMFSNSNFTHRPGHI